MINNSENERISFQDILNIHTNTRLSINFNNNNNNTN